MRLGELDRDDAVGDAFASLLLGIGSGRLDPAEARRAVLARFEPPERDEREHRFRQASSRRPDRGVF